jgi:hypothetical protein
MRTTGLSPPAGFHAASGAIGRKSEARRQQRDVDQAWRGPAARLESQWA